MAQHLAEKALAPSDKKPEHLLGARVAAGKQLPPMVPQQIKPSTHARERGSKAFTLKSKF